MRAKLRFVLSITILFGSFYGFGQQDFWHSVSSKPLNPSSTIARGDLEYALDSPLFVENLDLLKTRDKISIPFPGISGSLTDYTIWETPVFHPSLAKKYPQIRSYTGVSKDGKSKIRFSYSPQGLQATLMLIGEEKTHFIEPIKGDKGRYRLYEKNKTSSKSSFECLTPEMREEVQRFSSKTLVDEQLLRTFRIAVSTTGEYTSYHGGTIAGALAAINATLTRVNMVFETDLAVTLQLVANNDQIIFTNASTDPYTGSFNAQVQNTLTSIIGEENYDVGHLFHQDNDNGNAGFIGSVCVDNRKGSAFASALIPEGDLFDLDYVAHELGHQFGANHTWSFESEGTGVQVEPASGTTIMGYAGIVEGNNVAPNGDDYFHHASIVQIQEYLRTTSCAVTNSLSNSPPVISTQPDYSIPFGTPFVLSGSAVDADGDLLTYTWEQVDDGVVVSSTFGPENISGANFRSLPPTPNTERYFPQLSRVISGDLVQENPITDDAWETVSNVKRELNFALTVRDNNPEGGQVASDSIIVSVENTAGPFLVTSQAAPEAYIAGSVQTITWDVASTNEAPINASMVDILLSTDGGVTFTTELAEDLPNIGTAQIQLPAISTTSGRIMVKASDNIFFAVNSADFTIEETQALLNFSALTFEVCQPDDLIVNMDYETFSGFSETMNLSISSSQPFTSSFSPTTVASNGTAITLTLGNISAIPVGKHAVEVIASGASFTTSTTIEINVFNATFNAIELVNPQDGAVGTNVNPAFTWMIDENYTSYDIQIASDVSFATLVESALVTVGTYQSSSLLPETEYFWRVRPRNLCGVGAFSAPFSFTTSVVNCAEFESSDVPQEISSVGTPTILATTFIAQDLLIADINVNVELSHTFLEDLTLSLTSPSGTKVTLLSRNCGNLNNIVAVFDDDGIPLQCSGNPAISGSVQPLGSLASFNGESTLGEWILEIQDAAVSDGGSLDAFSLDICVEGVFRPDDDEDGVFDDGDDLCLGTPKGTLVDTSGCPITIFPADNFSISLESESCRQNNDGRITIGALDTTISYEATLTGNGINTSNAFTNETQFSNLGEGTYQLCITGTDGITNYRETCFDLLIEEPEELSVFANLLGDGATVQLQMQGGELYNIQVNEEIEQTVQNEFLVSLKPGLNVIRVTTGLQCQGVYEKSFFIGESPLIFPNPATDIITIYSGFQNQEVGISLYASDGRLIARNSVWFDANSFDFDVSRYTVGLYYLVLESNGIKKTSKFIKQ